MLKKIAITLFMITSFFSFFMLNKATAITGEFSINMIFFDYGFKSTKGETSKSLDKITISNFENNITLHLSKNYYFNLGYKYNYLLQSLTYGGLTFSKDKFKLSTGLSLGFYNELPLKFIPGAYGNIEIFPLRKLKLSIFGHSSLFLKRLFSLEPVTSDFDQNILNLKLFYQAEYVNIGIKYNNIDIYKLTPTGYINNKLQDYQFKIKTNLKNSLINSDTAIGGNKSTYKTPSINDQFIQIYVDETLIINIKKVNLNIGTRINILGFTLKDIKSTSLPKLPYLNLHTGINYQFGK